MNTNETAYYKQLLRAYYENEMALDRALFLSAVVCLSLLFISFLSHFDRLASSPPLITTWTLAGVGFLSGALVILFIYKANADLAFALIGREIKKEITAEEVRKRERRVVILNRVRNSIFTLALGALISFLYINIKTIG